MPFKGRSAEKNLPEKGKIIPSMKDAYIELAVKDFDAVKKIIDNMPEKEMPGLVSEAIEPEKKIFSELSYDEKIGEINELAEKYVKTEKIRFAEAWDKAELELGGLNHGN